jgi:chromosome segregation ATPase
MALNAAQLSARYKALRDAQAELDTLRQNQLAYEAQSTTIKEQLHTIRAAVRRILDDPSKPKEALEELLRRAAALRRQLQEVEPPPASADVDRVVAAVDDNLSAILDSIV